MRIISYKDLDKIKPKASIMLYCTCAEKDQLYYLQKIQYWYRHYQTLYRWFKPIDFYVFNDGKILHRNYPLNKRITVIEFDKALGRKSNAVFPGWKRSFGYATKLALKYRYFGHIENDCFVKQLDNFYKRLITDDFVGFPHCENYNIIQSGCMIINNHDFLKKISNAFLTKDKQYESELFQTQLLRMLPDYYNLGNSKRIQGPYEIQDVLKMLGENLVCLNQVCRAKLKTLEKTLLKKKNWLQKSLDRFDKVHYIITVAGIFRLQTEN